MTDDNQDDKEDEEFNIEELKEGEVTKAPIKVLFGKTFIEPPCSLDELFEKIGSPNN